MRKVVIVGIDALEYEYVVKHNLKPLMLSKYGVVSIPPELYHDGVPYTPLVWTAYLTGRNPRDLGIHHIYEEPRWVVLLKKAIRITPLRLIRGKKKLLKRLGINVFKPYMIRGTTIFDVVKDSLPINVPGVNLSSEFYMIPEMIDKGLFDEAVKIAYSVADGVFAQTIRAVKAGHYRLIFSYNNLLDIVGHLYWVKRPKLVLNAYMHTCRRVSRLLVSCRRRGYDVIILSDHGMTDSGDGVTGTHTKYGYWASTIHDFSLSSPYELIKKVVGIVEKEDNPPVGVLQEGT